MPYRELVERALLGDRRATEQLVREITPAIRWQVGRLFLVRLPSLQGGQLVEETLEITQHVLAVLFAERGRLLRRWDPDRGSLKTFVGVVARSRARDYLSQAYVGQLTMAMADSEEIEQCSDPESAVEARFVHAQTLELLLSTVRAQLTEMGRRMLHLLFVEQLTVAAIVERTGLSPDAIYQWRHRIRRRLVAAGQELG